MHRELHRLFRDYGLPDAIRRDNGAPFASNGIHGLNHLNAWWLQLGIVHQRMTPASPQENGAHERMHRVLKARATKPAAANAKLQPRVFNTFVQTDNDVRPHAALNDDMPAAQWRPSARLLPTRIIPPTYPGHFDVRRISTAGTFRLHHGQPFFTPAFNGEMIGLKEICDGRWKVRDSDTLLGRFDERTRTITGAPSLKNDCEPCPRTKCHLSPRLFNPETTRRCTPRRRTPRVAPRSMRAGLPRDDRAARTQKARGPTRRRPPPHRIARPCESVWQRAPPNPTHPHRGLPRHGNHFNSTPRPSDNHHRRWRRSNEAVEQVAQRGGVDVQHPQVVAR